MRHPSIRPSTPRSRLACLVIALLNATPAIAVA
ncbi:MAG: hypothetical protein RIS35_859, partial [Pseudomonadota bacterium]